MPWQFTDDYGKQYPALDASILSELVFSDHKLDGTAFTGSLDIAATKAALGTLGKLLGVTTISVSGTVTNENNTLTVTLASTDANVFVNGLKDKIPLISSAIQSAGISIHTQITTADEADQDLATDAFLLNATLRIGSSQVALSTQVPMNGGFFVISGDFTGVGIKLSDLGFLMGSLGAGDSWFPAQQLGPFAAGTPAFQLLSLSLTVYVQLNPLQVSIDSVTASVGITGVPLMGQALYLNPLGVVVTVTSPTSKPVTTTGIHGAIVLCNYAKPGQYTDPDLTFSFDMILDTFSISAELENPAKVSVNTMLQDLMGKTTNVGLPDTLTVNKLDFYTTADKKAGKITQFSTDIAMSGGFGLFKTFDLEEIAISVQYDA